MDVKESLMKISYEEFYDYEQEYINLKFQDTL